MMQLLNDDLRVDLIDPTNASDRRRLGTRYCWGGYIWQVLDARGGPLLAGPEWPHAEPSPFNGQGVPESFRAREFGTNRPLTINDAGGFAIGIGELSVGTGGAMDVTQPCAWQIDTREGEITFSTAHAGIGLACSLERAVRLVGRSVLSRSRVANTGERPLPLHWFAHPFFPLTDRLITCRLPRGTTIASNPGFNLSSDGELTLQRRFEHERDGHMEELALDAGQPFRVRLSHPVISHIDFATDFAPSRCPVWANSNTFSIEPYIMTELAPGAVREWTLRYEFGGAGSAVRR